MKSRYLTQDYRDIQRISSVSDTGSFRLSGRTQETERNAELNRAKNRKSRMQAARQWLETQKFSNDNKKIKAYEKQFAVDKI